MKVCKFGGSSLADAAQVRKVCDIVAADPARRIVVVSAPGRRHAGDIKVTDLLIEAAEVRRAGRPTAGKVDEIVARYAAIAADLDLPDAAAAGVRADIEARLGAGIEHPEHFMDTMKAAGEDNCARLMAEALQARGLQARYLGPRDGGLLLSEEHGQARILPESYDRLAAALGDAVGITVFPGFFGFSPAGKLVTFSRGGSDITGAVLAAAVNADLYENFTDVDSVLVADPGIVDHPRAIGELTFREMRELSYAGFNVLHDEAIMPAVHAGIPICVRSTDNPAAPGTRIVPERTYEPGQVVGISSDAGFCTVLLSKYLMNRELGFGRRVLQIFEEERISYEHMPSGIDSLSVIVRQDDFDEARQEHVLRRIREELEPDDMDIEHGLALIMIVGEGMRYTVGKAAQAVGALAAAGVNIEMMNQGASEISMMFGVKEVDRRRAVRSLYRAFFESEREGE